MVVKGDGSLISDRMALQRPVETVLSGPAASVVGARWLTGIDDMVVSDIGGTTTDIAVLEGGRPALSRDGARVGAWRTMVEAVAVRTVGIGGDSEVRIDPAEGLVVGPQRAVPLSLLAAQHPPSLDALRRQVERGYPMSLDGRFALRNRPLDTALESLGAQERRIWEALAHGPLPLEALVTSHLLDRPLLRLVERGLVVVAAFTPSDAAHVLGTQAEWSAEAAELGARLWIRRASEPGWAPPPDIAAFARRVQAAVVGQSALALVEAALAHEGSPTAAEDARSRLPRRALAGEAPMRALIGLRVALTLPLVGVGAPAGAYYPAIAERLSTRLVLPDHAGVANAIGAVASGVVQTVRVAITSPEEGRFRVHAPEGVRAFGSLDEAAEHAEAEARLRAEALAREAGGDAVEMTVSREDRIATMAGGLEVFVESTVTATAAARPRLA